MFSSQKFPVPSTKANKVKRIMIEAAQIRGARALLALSQAGLSELASVSATTIKRLESATEIRGAAETLWKIQTALEEAGVEFIPADETRGPGVRLKQRRRTETLRKDPKKEGPPEDYKTDPICARDRAGARQNVISLHFSADQRISFESDAVISQVVPELRHRPLFSSGLQSSAPVQGEPL